ncbi:MAG: FadR family transcriptional regulator [Bacteroidales bacterium]|nr:FadR family transcriptional regulator [Bacteroidales bacterium]
MKEEIINNFKQIEYKTPVDIIIEQIRQLIESGQLKSGDRLPSERQLAERFGVGRTYVRDAIKKLEFYGILNTIPQSGTLVAGLGVSALKGLISNVLKLEKADFFSLVETRVLLEVEGIKLAAQRRSIDNLINIKESLNVYYDQVAKGKDAVEEDFLFHLSIAEASQNSVIKSLLLIITPEIVQIYNKLHVCADGVSLKSFEEHEELYKYIEKQDAKKAMAAMKNHLSSVLDFAKKQFR